MSLVENPRITASTSEYFKPGSPNLDRIVADEELYLEIESREFKIEGLGKGRVRFYRDKKIIDKIREGEIKFRIPTQESEFRGIIRDRNVTLDVNSLPIEISVEIDGLTETDLPNTGCVLDFEGRKFEGIPFFDRGELSELGFATLHFKGWVDKSTQEEIDSILFPPDPEVLSKIKLLIYKKTTLS